MGTAGTYGDSTHVAQITTDAKGRVTAAVPVTITGAAPTGAAGGVLTGTYPNPGLATTIPQAESVVLTDSATSTTEPVLTLGHDSSGSIAAGFGSQLVFELHDSTAADVFAGMVETKWVNPAHATPSSSMGLSVVVEGATTKLLELCGNYPTALTGEIGFFGVAPVVQQTGDVAAALVALGLMSGSPSYANVFPAGMITPYGGLTAPTGWQLCDGSAVSRTTYSTLLGVVTFALTGTLASSSVTVTGLSSTTNVRVGAAVEGVGVQSGTTVASILGGTSIALSKTATANGAESLTFFPYGDGDGSTTFNVPNLIGRVPAGADPTGTVLASAKPALGATTDGEETHTLALAEMPAHTHTINLASTSGIASGPNYNLSGSGGVATSSAGGGAAHNNLQPYLAVSYIIKLTGSAAGSGGAFGAEPSPPTSAAAAAVRSSPSNTFSLVAPLGTKDAPRLWEGRAAKKPWHYRVTAILPHLNTPEYLVALVDLLRLQSERPYVVVVDTGSSPAVCAELEKMRADDLEVHFIKSNGYVHSSAPVCVALDLGFAVANTESIFLTHCDCFPMRQDALEWLAGQCDADCPIVGWEMSDRSWLTDQWKGMVSHTFTMVHAETIRRIGATWNMHRAAEIMRRRKAECVGESPVYGWPDTETAFNMVLREHGIVPKLLGPELNYVRQTTDWWDHARSYPSQKLYGGGDALEYAPVALDDAKRRVAEWRGESTAPLRLDLGGGRNPREGFTAVDRENAPYVVDFEKLRPDGPDRLPFADGSVEEVYCAHTLEHVLPYKGLLWEIARVCRVGAKVEIRVPHWNGAMALTNDHKHTVSPAEVRSWCETGVEYWWKGSARRLKRLGTEHVPSEHLAEVKALFPQMTDEQAMRFVPDACSEVRYRFEVVAESAGG